MRTAHWIWPGVVVLAAAAQTERKADDKSTKQPKMAVVVLRLVGLKDCDGCKMEVHDALSKAPGVSKVEITKDRTRCTVRYNAEKAKVSDLIAAVHSAGDFEAREVKTAAPPTAKSKSKR